MLLTAFQDNSSPYKIGCVYAIIDEVHLNIEPSLYQANNIFQNVNLTLEERVSRSVEVTEELVNLTNVPVNTSLLPAALEVANMVLRDVITVLNDNQESVDSSFQQVDLCCVSSLCL